eukprot:CAMPEP_0198528854 /NCGR_PEP_ID=MMETSP1462-20131121/25404_1 /TAXON_ID=1333877 /ORGANISM="Brandtodinium nutriculum, Strain RCC3387" /LENGTH=114 /DNA_ID=CAMNT_0044258683 /DNA_START=116 /DNA_END=457 /DNA_ORIENTATION=-
MAPVSSSISSLPSLMTVSNCFTICSHSDLRADASWARKTCVDVRASAVSAEIMRSLRDFTFKSALSLASSAFWRFDLHRSRLSTAFSNGEGSEAADAIARTAHSEAIADGRTAT